MFGAVLILKMKKTREEMSVDTNQWRILLFFFSSPLSFSCPTSDPHSPTSLSCAVDSSALALSIKPRWGRLLSWLCGILPGCSTPSHLRVFLPKCYLHRGKSAVIQ